MSESLPQIVGGRANLMNSGVGKEIDVDQGDET